MARDILYSLKLNTKVKCGFANIKDVNTLEKEDKMESFFLSETLKYLFLIFDKNNFVNINNFNKYPQYIFNTEGLILFKIKVIFFQF
jgi:hypothetical protein